MNTTDSPSAADDRIANTLPTGVGAALAPLEKPSVLRACRRDWQTLTLAVLLAGLGVFLRVSPQFAGFQGPGHDEKLYLIDLEILMKNGITGYAHLVKYFLTHAHVYHEKIVPPTRSLFLISTWAWLHVAGGDMFSAMKTVSALASIAVLVVSALFAWRLGGKIAGLAMLAWMDVAPLQVFNAHRALIDGYLSLWSTLALWLLWECLQCPRDRRLLVALGAAIVAMVLTKETSVFVWVGFVAILATQRWYLKRNGDDSSEVNEETCFNQAVACADRSSSDSTVSSTPDSATSPHPPIHEDDSTFAVWVVLLAAP